MHVDEDIGMGHLPVDVIFIDSVLSNYSQSCGQGGRSFAIYYYDRRFFAMYNFMEKKTVIVFL